MAIKATVPTLAAGSMAASKSNPIYTRLTDATLARKVGRRSDAHPVVRGERPATLGTMDHARTGAAGTATSAQGFMGKPACSDSARSGCTAGTDDDARPGRYGPAKDWTAASGAHRSSKSASSPSLASRIFFIACGQSLPQIIRSGADAISSRAGASTSE